MNAFDASTTARLVELERQSRSTQDQLSLLRGVPSQQTSMSTSLAIMQRESVELKPMKVQLDNFKRYLQSRRDNGAASTSAQRDSLMGEASRAQAQMQVDQPISASHGLNQAMHTRNARQREEVTASSQLDPLLHKNDIPSSSSSATPNPLPNVGSLALSTTSSASLANQASTGDNQVVIERALTKSEINISVEVLRITNAELQKFVEGGDCE